MRDLGRTLEVIRISIHIDNAVGIILHDIRTGSQRLTCLLLHAGQITLRESEAVVLIIIQTLVPIVVHRSDRNLQLVDH